MNNLKNREDFINEANNPVKERLINRIKNLVQRSVKVMPWERDGKIDLDDCYGWDYKGGNLDVISVYADGIICNLDDEEIQLNWEEMMELSEYYLREIYNNTEGTIRNDAW